MCVYKKKSNTQLGGVIVLQSFRSFRYVWLCLYKKHIDSKCSVFVLRSRTKNAFAYKMENYLTNAANMIRNYRI